ncbi:MAG: hypothetical protein ACR2QK_22795 [Acidimicrobiales bacterium]
MDLDRQPPIGVERAATGNGRQLVVAVFSLWTLFVWGGRLRNLWLDPGGFGSAGRWTVAGAVAFTAIGLLVLGAWLVGQKSTRRDGARPAVRVAAARVRAVRAPAVLSLAVLVLAVLTVVVWLIRGVDIALGDHEAAFIAVHIVLAVVSIGLAALAARRVLAVDGDRGSVPASEPGRAPVG